MNAPPSATALSDIDWLTGPEGRGCLDALRTDQRPLHVQVQSLRKTLSPARVHLVLEQLDLRRRGAEKFSRAPQMFFARTSLEQATDEATAAYKAQRFAAGSAVADLCCGIGGDLLALATRGPVSGVERDAILARLAAANLAAYADVAHAESCVCCGNADDFDLASVDAWHIDPDRRAQGKRTTRVELHEPPLDAIDALLLKNGNAAIKLSPAAEPPPHWESAAELEWISLEGSCRQLVVWCGELARARGTRRATVLNRSGQAARTFSAVASEAAPLAGHVGCYVYEPDAAILAAGLAGALANELSLERLIPGGGYMTSDRLVEDEALASFAVLDVRPFDVKQIKAWLQQHGAGPLEVKKRGVEVSPEALRRELRCSGGEPVVLLISRWAGGVKAILARRLPRREPLIGRPE